MSTPAPDRPIGLRERKKAKTRAAIQRHALRLFAEQGYQQTTVDQIAAAAEVSPSTFFRYFGTKEETVTFDRLDPVMLAAFERQPADLDVLTALRRAVRQTYAHLDTAANVQERQRMRLFVTEPELASKMSDAFADGIGMLATAIAQRTGRRPDDLPVLAVAGAVSGVMYAVFSALLADESANWADTVDRALAQLETGLALRAPER